MIFKCQLSRRKITSLKIKVTLALRNDCSPWPRTTIIPYKVSVILTLKQVLLRQDNLHLIISFRSSFVFSRLITYKTGSLTYFFINILIIKCKTRPWKFHT